ncbi:MAG: hypothetical protein M0Z30_02345 [Actinomycetota bacterium]|nr:hypothetical protein [Actinomycetota bacterium]
MASLAKAPHDLGWDAIPDEIDDEDLHLALYCCYELHYQGLPSVDADWEWEPSLLGVRRRLEDRFLAYARALRRLGVAEAGCHFCDVHVAADEKHQDLATDAMVAGLLKHEPGLAAT